MSWLLRFYLTVRRPRNFLKLVCVYVTSSVCMHFFRGYDPDWGSTNLIFSIEATIASAVILMVQEESGRAQQAMLEKIIALEEKILGAEERILKALEAR